MESGALLVAPLIDSLHLDDPASVNPVQFMRRDLTEPSSPSEPAIASCRFDL
jgi:hypothetical protein